MPNKTFSFAKSLVMLPGFICAGICAFPVGVFYASTYAEWPLQTVSGIAVFGGPAWPVIAWMPLAWLDGNLSGYETLLSALALFLSLWNGLIRIGGYAEFVAGGIILWSLIFLWNRKLWAGICLAIFTSIFVDSYFTLMLGFAMR